MKKIFLSFMVLVLSASSVFAIDWMEVVNPNGRVSYLDRDSVKEYKTYYFYNIKASDNNNEDVVVTIQSAKSNPFSARIKVYTPSEYDMLGGDYENITLNMTKKLEPVTFDSTVNACYKEAKKIILKKNVPQLTF